jgi:hypothetical protein
MLPQQHAAAATTTEEHNNNSKNATTTTTRLRVAFHHAVDAEQLVVVFCPRFGCSCRRVDADAEPPVRIAVTFFSLVAAAATTTARRTRQRHQQQRHDCVLSFTRQFPFV